MRRLVALTTILMLGCGGGGGGGDDTATDQPEDTLDTSGDTTADTTPETTDTAPDTGDTVEDTPADVPEEDGAEPCTGCWVDPTSGLVWENPPMGGELLWSEAGPYCDALSLGGHGPGEWRLPTFSELRTIVRGCPAIEDGGACGVTDSCTSITCMSSDCAGCSIMGGPGAGGCYWDPALEGVCEGYWSSSSVEGDPSLAWSIHFAHAAVDAGLLDSYFSLYCRCVNTGT